MPVKKQVAKKTDLNKISTLPPKNLTKEEVKQ